MYQVELEMVWGREGKERGKGGRRRVGPLLETLCWVELL